MQRPMATKERRYQPPTSLVVAGWVEGIADYERRGSSTPTALGVLDTGTRMQSGTVQGGLDFNWTRTNVPWLDQMVLGIVASRSSAKLDINYGASATLEGWGIGAYWMGVTGPWSLDAVTKLDYFNYTPTGGTPPVPGIPSDFFFTNHTTAANLNYRIPMGWTTSFIEPTVGVMYVRTDARSGHSQSRDWRPAAFAGRRAPGKHLGLVERRERARNGQAPCLQQRTCLGTCCCGACTRRLRSRFGQLDR